MGHYTKNWRYGLAIFVAIASPGSAQLFSAGVKAGVPATNFLGNADYYSPTMNRYIVGGTVELRLPLGLGVEVDALYRHYGYSGGSYTSDKTTMGDWEFPILAKYRLPGRILRPFVDAGPAVDTLSGTSQTTSLLLTDNQLVTNTTSSPGELNQRTIAGFVAGAGADLHAARLHVLPELRYTRWKDEHFEYTQSPPAPHFALHSNLNQVEFLLGITF
jgi:hypothetical protein